MSRPAYSSMIRQASHPRASLFDLFAAQNARSATKSTQQFSFRSFSNQQSTSRAYSSYPFQNRRNYQSKPALNPSQPLSQPLSCSNPSQKPYSTSSSQSEHPTQSQSQSTSEQSPSQSQKIGNQTPQYSLTFTCRPCSHRSSHTITKQAYHSGTVLIQCPNCKNRHLIADHLKIFSDAKVTLEDILAKKTGGAEKIRYGAVNVESNGDVELFPEGWEVEGVSQASQGESGSEGGGGGVEGTKK